MKSPEEVSLAYTSWRIIEIITLNGPSLLVEVLNAERGVDTYMIRIKNTLDKLAFLLKSVWIRTITSSAWPIIPPSDNIFVTPRYLHHALWSAVSDCYIPQNGPITHSVETSPLYIIPCLWHLTLERSREYAGNSPQPNKYSQHECKAAIQGCGSQVANEN